MEVLFKHLKHLEARITEAMEEITFEIMEVGIEAAELVFLSYYQYLALVVVEFLDF